MYHWAPLIMNYAVLCLAREERSATLLDPRLFWQGRAYRTSEFHSQSRDRRIDTLLYAEAAQLLAG